MHAIAQPYCCLLLGDIRALGQTALAAGVPAWCHSSMTDTPPRDTGLDRDLNSAPLDHALTMVVDRPTPEQRAQLRQRVDKIGKGNQPAHQASLLP